MIISASRRTDIPAFYSGWFFRRLEEGYVLVRNPMNPRMVSRVPLDRRNAECIVFWTKNPAPMAEELERLSGFNFFFHFTLNAYGTDLEPRLPALEQRLETFRRLSSSIGPDRILWRYDPVIVSRTYPVERHLEIFSKLAFELKEHTRSCTISFVTWYAKVGKALRTHGAERLTDVTARRIVAGFSETAQASDLFLRICSDDASFENAGCGRGRCVDPDLVELILGKKAVRKKDPGQRKNCGCLPSVDIGTYASCLHGCVYCYASGTPAEQARRRDAYDPGSPFLCGSSEPDDRITARDMKSCIEPQGDFFG